MEEGVRNIPGDEREGSPLEKTHCDWLPPRVSTPSPLESLEVGFRFGFVFSRESGFRDYLGFFFKFLFIATSDPTKRTPFSWSMKGTIKARLNHASPKKRTSFRRFVLFLTPQGVFATPRLRGAPHKRL
ncbi:hypothetical protein VitviT2T_024257 [Vitis vinifera]|uniref:Uncharacterized protein n=1 Tax=Vitis vinifera TaxID=29760 RepID=A0ABY9DH24_VITVI|nr:hypothetical protein VitviT2T_024257 [Vitis vinifera]